MIPASTRTIFDEEHVLFRDQVRRFVDRAVEPNVDRWEEEGNVDREFWSAAGDVGLLCPTVSPEYGGLGLDFRYNAIVNEELAYAVAPVGVSVQSDIVTPYLEHYGSEEQKTKWLPRMIAGETVSAIAMTEPGAGSDLQGIRTTARRDGDSYVINGSKTFITNGQHGDLIVVVARTKPEAGSKGISLILVEGDREGFVRGRNLDKIGQKMADTSELFFNDVRIPVTNLLGEEGRGFGYMMSELPQERLAIACQTQGSAQRAFDEAVAYTKQRAAFGKMVFDFQNTRFVLADLAAKLQVGWAHIDWAIARHVEGKLTTAEASAAKLFHSELQNEICDKALQLHGGAGYMNEYRIARLWRDARITRIYGGTSEIMKEVVARSL
jgi:alkylation response protein AidB-like acyl-CoA dehydrogenase